MRRFLYFALLFLTVFACAGPEPPAVVPTKGETPEGPIATDLLARKQMERLNDIGTRFLQLLDAANWEEEALFLDAAVASLKADDEWVDGASTSFTVNGVPGEARLGVDGSLSTLTLLRAGSVISTAYLREDGAVDVNLQHYRFTSEAPAEGLTISTSTLWKDGKVIASMEVTPIQPGVAHVDAQVMDGEAQVRGTVEDASMQELKLDLTPFMSEDDGKALAARLDRCVSLGLYYPDYQDTRAAVIGIGPLHRKTRFDDYWTWQWMIRFPDGLESPVSALTSYMELQDVSSSLTTLRVQLANLLPHIYP